MSLQDEMISIIKKNAPHTLIDDLEESKAKITDAAKNSVAIVDSYGNKLASIGTDDKVQSFTNYGFSNDTLNWSLWLALYNDSWVFRRAIDKPSQDEIRCGITLEGSSDFDKIYKDMKIQRTNFINLLQWGALFGGSIACIMFDNMKDKDYANPMNISKLKDTKVIRIYVVDRWYGVAPSQETVTNMSDIDFGKPKYYDVTLADGNTVRFHHDYVLRYEHRTAPKLVKNGMLQGWGYAEGSHILNELSRDDQLKASVQSLVNKALIEVIKMPGMRGVFMGADNENESQLRKRLEMVNWGRTYNSLTFLDKDDEYQQNEFSGLGGLSDLLEKNMWLVSAALDMQGVLFGDLKQGFSDDTNALERYDQVINERCETLVRPVYTKYLQILYKKYDINDKVEFTFNSLLTKQHTEEQVKNLLDFVDLCGRMLDAGVIEPSDYAEALQKYTSKGIIDFGFTEEKINNLKSKTIEEMENINIDEEV